MGTTKKRARKGPVPTIRTGDVLKVLDLMSNSVNALRAVVLEMGGPKTTLIRGTKRGMGRLSTEEGIWIIPKPILSPICKDDAPFKGSGKQGGPR